ncbi:hypothetical protein H4217_004982 [Coemansia sp. RSA 1939]|nr:hypothetical protein H4217_004982 [Coemansia sp. RSA 1939]KAJ2592455.1 hypothetical protein EV177_008725 [Coemansia sp. RSA 1804]
MMTAKSEGRASNCGIAESNASLATLLRETSDSRYAPSLLLPTRGGCHSTTTTLSTDATSKQHGPSYNTAAIAAAAAAATTLSQASTTVYSHLPPVQEDPHQSQRQLLLLRTKRKAKEEEQQDSPRTKRRKMIHQDVGNFELSPVTRPIDFSNQQQQNQQNHRRALVFSPGSARSPMRSPAAHARRFHRRPPLSRSPATPDPERFGGLPAASTKLRRKLF